MIFFLEISQKWLELFRIKNQEKIDKAAEAYSVSLSSKIKSFDFTIIQGIGKFFVLFYKYTIIQ